MPEDVNTSASLLFTQQVRELVAIGAAIAANCETCFKFHYDKAHKLSISKEDMLKTVETAKMVKDVSSSNVLDLANKYLQNYSPKEQTCSQKRACCS